MFHSFYGTEVTMVLQYAIISKVAKNKTLTFSNSHLTLQILLNEDSLLSGTLNLYNTWRQDLGPPPPLLRSICYWRD